MDTSASAELGQRCPAPGLANSGCHGLKRVPPIQVAWRPSPSLSPNTAGPRLSPEGLPQGTEGPVMGAGLRDPVCTFPRLPLPPEQLWCRLCLMLRLMCVWASAA